MNKEYKDKELMTIYDNAKSFYKKAFTRFYYNNGLITRIELYSYKTKVCTISNCRYRLNHNVEDKLLLSHTTLRHIKEFLKQFKYMYNNYDKVIIESKKDILKYDNVLI